MPRRFGDTLAEADRRWTALGAAHPGLRPAITLQRQLVGECVALLERLAQLQLPLPPADPAAVVEKLARGVPALRGEPVELPIAVLAPSLDRFCQYLGDSEARSVAQHLLEAFQSGRVNRESLLRASIARNQRAIRSGASQTGLAPDLVWLVGELATAPFAQLLQDRLLSIERGKERTSLQSALREWDRGYCPVCGSWPALVEYDGEERTLRCSYCAAQWRLGSRRCVYCDERNAAFRNITPIPGVPQHILELCDRCRGYTKAVQTAAPARFVLLAVVDLETFVLDRTAAEAGYGRPPLIELDDLPNPP